MKDKPKIIEESKGVIAYDCGKVLCICLEKGAVVSDHKHRHSETVYLIKGEVEAIIGDKKEIVSAPAKFVIPGNTYHKFTALTDVVGIEVKNNFFQRFCN